MAINFGDVLGGLGAAYGGRAQEYAQGIQQREQGLTEQKRAELEARQKAMYQDGYQAFQMLSDGNIDGIISLANDRLEMLSTFPDADPSDTLGVLRDAEAAKAGDPMAIRNLSMTLSSAAQTAQRMGLVPQQAAPEEYTLSPGEVRYRGGEQIASVAEAAPQEPGAVQALRIRAAEAGLQPNTPAYVEFMKAGGSGSGVNVTNVMAPGENKYVETRAAQQAATMGELEKSAESAYRANQALSRFVASSAAGDAGGAQPLITGVKSFLSSFGFDPAGLTDTAIMQQAVGDILGAKMAELGARGLTDKDMQVLRDALPQVNTSHEARVAVADIIKKANENTLREYDTQVQYEEQTYPEMNFRRPSWAAGLREQLQSTSVDDPLGILQ